MEIRGVMNEQNSKALWRNKPRLYTLLLCGRESSVDIQHSSSPPTTLCFTESCRQMKYFNSPYDIKVNKLRVKTDIREDE